jgi:hypothetical protein
LEHDLGLITISATNDLPKGLEVLKRFSSDKWPKILAIAANKTALDVLEAYRQEMPKYIDRPVPFTLNSMYVKIAKSPNIEATVLWRDGAGKGTSAGKYLKPQVDGGQRVQKRFEKSLEYAGLMPKGYFAVPTKDCPVNQFGNVAPGLYVTILSYVRASMDSTQNRRVQKLSKMSTSTLIKQAVKGLRNIDKIKAKEERAKAKVSKYFTVMPGQSNLPIGIYERVNLFGGAIRRLFNYVSKVTYRKRFPFETIGSRKASEVFPAKLARAIEKVIASGNPE